MKDLHRAITKAARRKPATAKDIELWAHAQHGARVSDESIRKALAGGEIDPTACSVELLFALRGFYGLGVDGLGTFAEARMRAALSLAGNLPDNPGDQASDASGWLTATAGSPPRPALTLLRTGT